MTKQALRSSTHKYDPLSRWMLVSGYLSGSGKSSTVPEGPLEHAGSMRRLWRPPSSIVNMHVLDSKVIRAKPVLDRLLIITHS